MVPLLLIAANNMLLPFLPWTHRLRSLTHPRLPDLSSAVILTIHDWRKENELYCTFDGEHKESENQKSLEIECVK